MGPSMSAALKVTLGVEALDGSPLGKLSVLATHGMSVDAKSRRVIQDLATTSERDFQSARISMCTVIGAMSCQLRKVGPGL